MKVLLLVFPSMFKVRFLSIKEEEFDFLMWNLNRNFIK